jgi:hypothetical protein
VRWYTGKVKRRDHLHPRLVTMADEEVSNTGVADATAASSPEPVLGRSG